MHLESHNNSESLKYKRKITPKNASYVYRLSRIDLSKLNHYSIEKTVRFAA